jgi:hypothetical protein
MVHGAGFRVQGSGCRVQGPGSTAAPVASCLPVPYPRADAAVCKFRVHNIGFRVEVAGLGLRVKGLGFRVQGSALVSGSGFSVGFGFWV